MRIRLRLLAVPLSGQPPLIVGNRLANDLRQAHAPALGLELQPSPGLLVQTDGCRLKRHRGRPYSLSEAIKLFAEPFKIFRHGTECRRMRVHRKPAGVKQNAPARASAAEAFPSDDQVTVREPIQPRHKSCMDGRTISSRAQLGRRHHLQGVWC